MSRRRKRKKQNSLEDKNGNEKEVNPPRENLPQTPAPTVAKVSEESVLQPIPSQKIQNELKVDDELELELSDEFGDAGPPTPSEGKSALPSGEDKREARPRRRDADPLEPIKAPVETVPAKSKPSKHPLEPQPKKRLAPASLNAIPKDDDLDDLDDDMEVPSSSAKTPSTAETVSEEVASLPEVSNNGEDMTPEEADFEEFSLKSRIKAAVSSLSIFEQASLGLLAIILVVAAIWSNSIVSARIPNTVIASKLKYPLKGDSVVLSNYQSYWRSPIREGDNLDEGVSESIEVIPVVKVALDPESKAKSLRFLFRDEEGRYVGDSTTVDISGAKFLPSDSVTSFTSGNTATIRSTTGFEHEGELISYLADETFQWEVVILESKDGVDYTEFMAIPISAQRKDNS